MALFLIVIEIMLNMGNTEGVSSTLGSTLFQKTKQRNVTVLAKLVCCQDYLLWFLTFRRRMDGSFEFKFYVQRNHLLLEILVPHSLEVLFSALLLTWCDGQS